MRLYQVLAVVDVQALAGGCQSSGMTAITSISISHCGCPRAEMHSPVEMGNTPLSHLPTSW